MPPADLRGQVAAALEGLCASGSPLHIDAPGATWRRHTLSGTDPYAGRYTASRIRLHERLVEEFLAGDTNVATDGHAAVATAGPPAVGKSTRLNQLGYGTGWRRIDADLFKAMLIEDDLRNGVLAMPDEIAPMVLPDGHGVMAMELAGLYHRESTVVADKAQEICLAARENIVIEGTLSWAGLAPRLVADLVAAGYQTLDVILVEVPLQVALEQALRRWWTQRQASGLGGRFTPAATVTSLYLDRTATICATNARDLVDRAAAADITSSLIGNGADDWV